MNDNTKTKKGYDGWEATTTREIAQVEDGMRVLKLRTAKIRGGIATNARVSVVNEALGKETTIIFQDYSKSNICPMPCKRVTEKTILQAHEQAKTKLDELTEEVKAFYVNLDAQLAGEG